MFVIHRPVRFENFEWGLDTKFGAVWIENHIFLVTKMFRTKETEVHVVKSRLCTNMLSLSHVDNEYHTSRRFCSKNVMEVLGLGASKHSLVDKVEVGRFGKDISSQGSFHMI